MDAIKNIYRDTLLPNKPKYCVCIALVFAILITAYSRMPGSAHQELAENNIATAGVETRKEGKKLKQSFKIKLLARITGDIRKKKTLCFPQDYTPNSEVKAELDTQKKEEQEQTDTSYMVMYISVLLLQISLIWAIVELLKHQSASRTKGNTKPPLNRTCSLADITLMRHQRRESMRKDHVAEHPDHRRTSRQIDIDNQVYRRCSFTVGPSEFKSETSSRKESFDVNSIINRRVSVDTETTNSSERRRSHSRLIHRH